MTEKTENSELVLLTADIVSAHVSNNSVETNDVAVLISTVYQALTSLGAPAPEDIQQKPKGAVSIRSSMKPDALVSMIDGKPYKMLRRHIAQHGYTPDSYRSLQSACRLSDGRRRLRGETTCTRQVYWARTKENCRNHSRGEAGQENAQNSFSEPRAGHIRRSGFSRAQEARKEADGVTLL